VVARVAGAVLAATGLCAVTVLPAQADAVRDQEMWVLDMVHAPSAWPVTQGQGVLVAVIDSGVFPSVSDLAGSVTEGPNLSGVNTPQSNASWGVHGTWMASLIAGHGHGDGSAGIEGVAPQSRVLSIRVVTDRGDPNFGKYEEESNAEVQQALARAIRIATRRGADVISMSLGYGAASRPVRVALQNALDHGVVVVASSGNSGDTASALSTGQAPYSFPADYPGVLGVGAVTQTETAASFSSNNLSVEIAAPGVKVPAQGRDGQYWLVSGTSPACALAAGVAALIKSRYPRLSPALVDQAITSTAQNPPPKGYDDRVGFGTVDAAAALAEAATLTRDLSTGRGVKVATHFGGGAAAVPPVPVAPRGAGRLILYAVLVLAFLVIAAFAAVRLTRRSPAAVPVGESWQENAPWPGNGAREANGDWEGDRGWEGNGTWPGSEPWPAQQGRWQAPSGDGSAPQAPPALPTSLAPPVPPVPPGGPPAPSYRPDPSRRDLPPARTPPADPGSPGPPWPPPGQ
jgi:subtilisin family serine protease